MTFHDCSMMDAKGAVLRDTLSTLETTGGTAASSGLNVHEWVEFMRNVCEIAHVNNFAL